MDQDFIDEQRNADLLDALADLAYEQDQAMRESDQGDWDNVYKQYEDEYGIPSTYYPGSQGHIDYLGGEDISKEELYACDHYNERYVLPTYD